MKTNPQPIRFDFAEREIIEQIKRGVDEEASVSKIVRRLVRIAGPLVLKGKVPWADFKPRKRTTEAEPAASSPAADAGS